MLFNALGSVPESGAIKIVTVVNPVFEKFKGVGQLNEAKLPARISPGFGLPAEVVINTLVAILEPEGEKLFP